MNHKSKTEASGPLPAYEIVQGYQIENGQWTWRPIEWGRATEDELTRIREDRVDGIPNRSMIVVWPLVKGRASTGMSGTLEGWIRGQRG